MDILQTESDMFGKSIRKWLLGAIAILFLLASCSLAIEDKEYPDINIVYPPSVPDNLKLAADYNNQTITLSWDKSEGADIYHVYYLPASEYVGGTFRKINSYTESKVFSFASEGELEQDEVYLFYVTAGSSDGSRSLESSKSEYLSGVTLSDFESTISIDSSFKPTISLSYCDLTSPIESISSVPEVYFRIYISTDDSKSGDVWQATVDNTATTVNVNRVLAANTSYYFDIELYVNGSETPVDTEKTTLTTDKRYQPEKIDNSAISLESNRSDGIKVTFAVPELSDYLVEEEVQYRFRIVRSSGSEEVTVLSETLLASYDSSTGTYSYLDTTVEPNRRYTYTVYAYYLFPSGVYYAQNESSGGYAAGGHLLSSPRGVSAEIEMLDESKLNYRADLSWLVDYEIPEGASFKISRRDASDLEGEAVEWTLSDYSPVLNYGVYSVSWSDDIALTEEEGRWTHSYVYTITMQYGDYQSAVLNGSSSSAVVTTPTVREMNILSDVTASEGKAGRVNLAWSTANTIEEISLDNVSFEILRSQDSQFSSYVAISGIDNSVLRRGYFTDLEAGDGRTVYYRLRATYTGNNDYNGLYSQEIVSGSTISAVEDLAATDGESVSESTLTWSPATGAQGYRVYILDDASGSFRRATDADGYYDSSDPCIFHFTRDAGTNDAGRVYTFTVRALDGEGNETGNGNIVKGSLLGPASITVTLTSGADYITVNWNDISGASFYNVEVYAENADVPFISERVRTGVGEFTLRASDSRLESAGEYPLSQVYSFSIVPSGDTTSAGTAKVSGSWIMPPKNITATKGEYRDMVVVSWNSVDGANGYNVYRRLHDSSNDWTLVTYTDRVEVALPFYSTDTDYGYDYTVRTVSSGVMGPYQSYFEADITYPDEAANYGITLADPQYISGAELTSQGLLEVSFIENSFATGYQISISGGQTYTFTNELINSTSSSVNPAAGVAFRKDGRIVCYVPRPVITTRVALQAVVYSQNTAAPVSGNDTSYGYSLSLIPEGLFPYEIVNVTNNLLSSALHEVDDAFNGDWWISSEDQHYTGIGVEANGGFTRSVVYFMPALVKLNGRMLNQITASGSFGVALNYGYNGLAGYLGTDPPETLCNGPDGENQITVNLPYSFGTATISFNNARLDGTSGSYTVTYKGETTEVQYNQVSVKAF